MAENARTWAKDMFMGRRDLESYGFQSIDEREDPIPFADCLRAYMSSVESRNIAQIFEKAGMPYHYGLLLTGPQDAGKHTVGSTVAATLLSKSTYSKWAWITAADLEDTDEDGAKERLKAFFLPYIEDERTLEDQPAMGREILILEELERLPFFGALIDVVATLIHVCCDGGLAAPLVILAVEKEPTHYPTLGRELLQIRLNLPNGLERSEYLKRRFVCVSADSRIMPEEADKIRINGMTLPALVKHTEGFSYRQLEEMIYLVKLRAVYKASTMFVREASQFTMSDYALEPAEVASLLPCVGKAKQEEAVPQQQTASAPIEQILEPLFSKLTNAIAAMPAGGSANGNSGERKHTKEEKVELESLISDDFYNPKKRELLNHTW